MLLRDQWSAATKRRLRRFEIGLATTCGVSTFTMIKLASPAIPAAAADLLAALHEPGFGGCTLAFTTSLQRTIWAWMGGPAHGLRLQPS